VPWVIMHMQGLLAIFGISACQSLSWIGRCAARLQVPVVACMSALPRWMSKMVESEFKHR